MILDTLGELSIPLMVWDTFTSEPSGLVWCMKPNQQITFGDQICTQEHPMSFDHRDGFRAVIRFDTLVSLNKSWEVDLGLVFIPEGVVREM